MPLVTPKLENVCKNKKTNLNKDKLNEGEDHTTKKTKKKKKTQKKKKKKKKKKKVERKIEKKNR
jgi:hypothetical protein